MIATKPMPDQPPKPPAPPDPPAEPTEEFGWDSLEEEEEVPPDPLEEPWPAEDEEGTTWEDEPLLETEATEEDWATMEVEEGEQESFGDDPETAEFPPEEWPEEVEESTDNDWIEEEASTVTVGWNEQASLPTWGIHKVPARCRTGLETSTLYVSLRPGLPGRVTLVLGDQTVDVGVGEMDNELVAMTLVRLVGREFEATLRIVGTSGPPHLVLGRDVLAGRFLVDAGLTWTQRRSD